MRWKGGRQSANVFDRRGGGRGGMRVVGGLGGLGAVAFVVVALLLGVDPSLLLEPSEGPPVSSGANDEMREFVAVVLADTEDVWQAQLAEQGGAYEPTGLVLYTAGTLSRCGLTDAAIGPFYCPADRRIYLDLGFFDQLARGLGATGDFARPYVIGHEVGHHLQNLAGVLDKVHAAQQGLPEAEANRLSVRLEL